MLTAVERPEEVELLLLLLLGPRLNPVHYPELLQP